MSLASLLKDAGAVGALYFLVTMLLALVHSDESGANTRATLKAVGLGLSLLAMMVAAIMEPAAPTGPAELPLPGRPPRVPGVPEEQTMGQTTPLSCPPAGPGPVPVPGRTFGRAPAPFLPRQGSTRQFLPAPPVPGPWPVPRLAP